MEKVLGEHFIFMKPKNIVSGDFYWMAEKNNKIVITVADCTGHGVPGAFMSMLGHSFLNEIVNNYKITQPGRILNRLRDTVKKALHQTGKMDETKDGMDIALCSYHKESRILEYAGANIPLWLLRDGEVIEIKATRRPVGKHVIQQAFQTQKIEIQANDNIYLSSDGFAYHFGGRRNKNYMKKTTISTLFF